MVDRIETFSYDERIGLALERSVLESFGNEFLVDGDSDLRVLGTDSNGEYCDEG
jgi:hypothetical protein